MSMDLPTSLACFQSYIFFARALLVAATRKKKHRKDNSAVHYKENLFLYMFSHTNVSGAPLHDSWLSHNSHWCRLLRNRGGVWRYVRLEGGGHRLWCEMHICMSFVKYLVYPLLPTDDIQYLEKSIDFKEDNPCRVQAYSCFLAYRPSVGKWLLDWQILDLTPNKAEISGRAHSVIDKFAERGLRSLGVARQASTLDASCSQPNED